MSSPGSRAPRPSSLLAPAALALAVAAAALPFLVEGARAAQAARRGQQQVGRAAFAIVTPGSMRATLLDDLKKAPEAGSAIRDAAPIVALDGSLESADRRTRAPRVRVYGVDERFWTFAGVGGGPIDVGSGADTLVVSRSLADEFGLTDGERMTVTVPTADTILAATLYADRDPGGRRITGTLSISDDHRLAGLSPLVGADPVPAIFVPLARLQDDPRWQGRVNAMVIASASDDLAVQARTLDELLPRQASLDDYGLTLRVDPAARAVVVESRSGALDDPLVEAISRAAIDTGGLPTPVLTTLVRRIRAGEREVGESFISSLELQAVAPDVHAEELSHPPVVLNAWTADRLGVATGAIVQIEYFVQRPGGGVASETGEFEVAGVLPMSGLALQPALTPPLPGITGAPMMHAWTPRLPFDANAVTAADEEYWTKFTTTPKAFVPPPVGRALWRTGVMAATSVQVAPAEGLALEEALAQLDTRLRERIAPAMVGLHVRPLRQEVDQHVAAVAAAARALFPWNLAAVASALLLAVVAFDADRRSVAARATGAFAAGAMLAVMLAWLLAGPGFTLAATAVALLAALVAGSAGVGLWLAPAERLPRRTAVLAAVTLVVLAAGLLAWSRANATAATGRQAADGGFAMLARTTRPLLSDIAALSAPGQRSDGLRAFRAQDAGAADSPVTSGPRRLWLAAVDRTFIDEGRYPFSGALDRTDEERANPWLLLRREQRDASDPAAEAGSPIVPAVASDGVLASLQLKPGDDIPFTMMGRAVRLRIVAALESAELPDALFLSEPDFAAWLPSVAGYRWFAVDATAADDDRARSGLVDRLTPLGVSTDSHGRPSLDGGATIAQRRLLVIGALLLALATLPIARRLPH